LRAASAAPKQFRNLAGRPLLSWSLELLVSGGCTPVVVVAPADTQVEARRACAGFAEAVCISGGHTRQASVANGLELVHSSRVVVHDAVRPFATRADVHAVVDALAEADGAIVAVRVEETLKRVDDHAVNETVDRTSLWRAQTPQAFRVDTLNAAHRWAARDSFVATDDAQLLERYGGKVVAIEGRSTNIKLTYPEDFVLAECLSRYRT
jgi:2-C-methyl-D-erythritol 4-phosphate cytidylyltransferase / 2-C-methyl-D-erythritol 2,4-cyclodiphosphate synthase